MGFFKKAALFGGGIPVRPTTHKERRQKASLKELKKQTAALEQIAKNQKGK